MGPPWGPGKGYLKASFIHLKDRETCIHEEVHPSTHTTTVHFNPLFNWKTQQESSCHDVKSKHCKVPRAMGKAAYR